MWSKTCQKGKHIYEVLCTYIFISDFLRKAVEKVFAHPQALRRMVEDSENVLAGKHQFMGDKGWPGSPSRFPRN